MRRLSLALLLSFLVLFVARAQQAQQVQPVPPAAAPAPPPKPTAPPEMAWAYVVASTPVPGIDDPTPRRIPGSNLQFTQAQISNGYAPADWFPSDHPVMPAVVAKGKEPVARACALCHYPNGRGRPENAPISGLPKEYIVQQFMDFRADLRQSVEQTKEPTKEMIRIAKALTEAEINQVAEYYSSIKQVPWIRVQEARMIPKMKLAGSMFQPVGDGTTEPLGDRIVEAPVDLQQIIYRNPHVGFVAYVPVGSVKKGEVIVTTGANGKTLPCTTCHGPDLNGIGPVPGIAGRSPSYLARQLYDIKQGQRKGLLSSLMKPVVEHLTVADILNVTAYVASRPPVTH